MRDETLNRGAAGIWLMVLLPWEVDLWRTLARGFFFPFSFFFLGDTSIFPHRCSFGRGHASKGRPVRRGT
jgi:hypothetical protein